MLDSKPHPTPMAAPHSLSKFDSDPFDNSILYRIVVGALQYATLTCFDIAFAVNKLS
jgi:hypothetical protein